MAKRCGFLFAVLAFALTAPAAAQPAKIYAPVPVTIPPRPNDPSLEIFRARLSDLARKQDRKALAALLARTFFWERDFGGGFDKRKSPLVNFTLALGLDNDDGSGWRTLEAFAAVAPGPHGERKGVFCAPPEPRYDAKAFEAALKATGSDVFEWSYPARAGVAVRERDAPDAPVIAELALQFVHTDIFSRAPQFDPAKDWTPVILPDGRRGFVEPFTLLTPLDPRLCYVKAGNAWRIAGYRGGGD
jgi:hypothetical protein